MLDEMAGKDVLDHPGVQGTKGVVHIAHDIDGRIIECVDRDVPDATGHGSTPELDTTGHRSGVDPIQRISTIKHCAVFPAACQT